MKKKVILTDDYLQTFKNFGAVYESPIDNDGNYQGPLVAYAGRGEDGKSKVGYLYYNMSKIENNSRSLNFFAGILSKKIKEAEDQPDVVLGAPMGGIALATALSLRLGCDFAFAEKKIIELADKENNIREKSELILKRHEIEPGQKVLIIEDLCNNFSTTKEMVKLIITAGGEFIGIASLLNRSWPFQDEFYDTPVISVVDLPTDQFEQTSEEVKEHLSRNHIVLKPKDEWEKLEKAMEK
ncbi:MAG: phosphoribosyltransferase family protein [Patescibacteria group bacterium]|nr:phosphoribosyltransferase family protein [Patescibacteria group bacterium]